MCLNYSYLSIINIVNLIVFDYKPQVIFKTIPPSLGVGFIFFKTKIAPLIIKQR